MDDAGIVRLYFARDERAIEAAAARYGSGCARIARNILGSGEDAEECVNDAYLAAWNAIPPRRPARLGAFLGALTRNLAFNRYQRERAAKRGGGAFTLVLDELGECVSGGEDAEAAFDRRELLRALNAFVLALPPGKRYIFVRRYWYADAVGDIARACGRPANSVSKTLERTRKQLRDYLLERGFTL